MSQAVNVKKRAKEAFMAGYEAQIKGEVEQAIYLYSHSLEWHPSAEAYTFLGWAYSFQMKFEQAIRECHKAIQVDPDFGNPYNDIGAYLIEQGKEDEAITWLKKAMQAKRYESPWFPHYNLARIFEKRFDYAAALEEYEGALALNKEFDAARRGAERVKKKMQEQQAS